MNIQIALYRPTTIIDRLVCFFTRGDYSHSSTIMKDGSVIQSKMGTGVNHVPYLGYGESKGTVIDIFDVYLTTEQERLLTEFLQKQIGKKYDLLMVLGFVLYATRKGRAAYGKWFCSELMAAAFEKAGFPLLQRVEPWKISPYALSWSERIHFNKTIIVE